MPPVEAANPAQAALVAKALAASRVESPVQSVKPMETSNPTRIMFGAPGPGGVRGIVVPRHMWEGTAHADGMRTINKARAKVYGGENRDPLTIGQIGQIHKMALDQHFSNPREQQIADENAALGRLRAARHISPSDYNNRDTDTLDESEKLDTVNHERDPLGRGYIARASKGVAGHSLYTSGFGENERYHVLNTCPGQTAGCSGGVDANGVVDTRKGMCFAPKAEAQYVNASVRRASHEQAKHDPAMTRDWIIAHTGSLRRAAELGDSQNKVLLFRPNVVDETDVSSRHVINHLNAQRDAEGKPKIIANSYGKTNELHDPENGYYVTSSNVGPKTKLGYSIAEHISRDGPRVRSTILATNNAGKDIKNDQGNKTPPKSSYLITDVKRYSPLDKRMQAAITHAKYWSEGRTPTPADLKEGAEGHFDGNGRPTTPDHAHYGHTTVNGRRYDYQKQHILHPRMVHVGFKKDGSPRMIPTDSRFLDSDYLPKERFRSRNGKLAGAILMTTPTKSTSAIERQLPFTHHVDDSHVEHALAHRGEYEIDPPAAQEASRGREYIAPEPPPKKKKRAFGGSVEDDDGADDEICEFPEQSFATQRHLAHRRSPEDGEALPTQPTGLVDKAMSLARIPKSAQTAVTMAKHLKVL